MFDPADEQARADYTVLKAAHAEVTALGRELEMVQYETAQWERLFDQRLAVSKATTPTVIPALSGASLTA